MALFDTKNFNGEVFGAYVNQVPNLNRNELLKSGAIVEKSEYATMLPDQTGGNFVVIPIKARIGGEAQNYDGKTKITADSRATYTHGRIVVGRAHGWTEKDFSTDITGEDFMPAAQEVAEYWDDIDQATILATLKGVFSMNSKQAEKDFVKKHTYDITGNYENKVQETTLNNALQQALGDNKSKFSLAIVHSTVSTRLENLKLIAYMKYTDAQGIERDLTLATWNGRTLLIDDNMPTETMAEHYVPCKKTDDGALLCKTGASADGEVETSTVQETLTTAKDGDYVALVPESIAYTSYAFGNGAIEYTNCGVKVPYEMARNPAENGGENTMYSRQRKVFSPYGISWKNQTIISPTDEELATGTNWTLANSNESASEKYFPEKAIPIVRIKTLG